MIFQLTPFHSISFYEWTATSHFFWKKQFFFIYWLDIGLWNNGRKGVTFIVYVIRRNFIPYIIQCSPVGSPVPRSPLSHALDEEPFLPHLLWRAWGDQRQASHHKCLPRSLSSGWEAKWHPRAVSGQEQGESSHKPCFSSYPGSSSGFTRWEGSRAPTVVGHFEEHVWIWTHCSGHSSTPASRGTSARSYHHLPTCPKSRHPWHQYHSLLNLAISMGHELFSASVPQGFY